MSNIRHYLKYYDNRNIALILKYKILKYKFIELLINANQYDFVSFINKNIRCNHILKNKNIFYHYNGNSVKALKMNSSNSIYTS